MQRVQRRSKQTHAFGVSILVPHSSFSPTPTMTPLEIAYHKGRDMKRRGRPAENPHNEFETELAAEWDRGYNE